MTRKMAEPITETDELRLAGASRQAALPCTREKGSGIQMTTAEQIQDAGYWRARYRETQRNYDALAKESREQIALLSLQKDDHRWWRKVWREVSAINLLLLALVLVWAWINHGRIW